ncbi:putative antirestriction protein [Escherichia coli]|uniref:Antirestriction protein n=1 Tax=Escherichia coli TaxID=562 RepID=A0AAX2KJZ2_ECOLX|nr:putative antirestriction protein [Escherichia coli]
MYGATDTLRSYTEKRGKAAIIFLTGSLAKGSRRPALPPVLTTEPICSVWDNYTRKSPPAPLYPAMRGMALWVSALWPPCRVRAVPCLHLSRAGGDARVRFAAAVTRSLLPVCRDFPVVHPLRFRGLTLQLPSAVCVRLRLPLRPCIPALSPGFYGGTAPPGVAEYVNNGGKHHAICEICHSER